MTGIVKSFLCAKCCPKCLACEKSVGLLHDFGKTVYRQYFYLMKLRVRKVKHMVKSGNESKYSECGCSAFFFITPKCVKREKHTGVYAYIRMLGNTYEVPSTLPGIFY